MDLSKLDWERLKVFQAVADNGSITAAATALHVSPAKVSRDLEELERSLGHELFIRSTRGMELTTIGGVVLKSVRSMTDAVDAISTRVTEVAAEEPQRTVIAAQDAMATYWLARHLSGFHSEHPGTELMLKVVPETPSVAGGEADIAIQYEEPTAPNVISRQMGWIHYILYASPDYLKIHGIPETMFDLGRHRFLLHSGYNKQIELWNPKTPAWLQVLSRAMQSNSSTVILESCACDGGVAIMPTYVSEFERRVEPLLHIRPLASIKFWLVYSERLRGQPHAKTIIDWLRGSFDPDKHPCFREVYVPPERLGQAA